MSDEKINIDHTDNKMDENEIWSKNVISHCVHLQLKLFHAQ